MNLYQHSILVDSINCAKEGKNHQRCHSSVFSEKSEGQSNY